MDQVESHSLGARLCIKNQYIIPFGVNDLSSADFKLHINNIPSKKIVLIYTNVSDNLIRKYYEN